MTMVSEMKLLEREWGECEPDFLGAGEEQGHTKCETGFLLAQRGLTESRKASRSQDAIRVLDLTLQLNSITKQVENLSRRVSELEELPPPLIVPINTFAPKPFEPIGQLLVVVEPHLAESEEMCEYIATFVDGSVSVTGDTIEEAVALLKSRMVSQYNLLTEMPSERLGKLPQRQLAALKAVMRRTE